MIEAQMNFEWNRWICRVALGVLIIVAAGAVSATEVPSDLPSVSAAPPPESWQVIDEGPTEIAFHVRYDELPGYFDAPALKTLWNQGIRHEAAGELLASVEEYTAIAAQTQSSYPYWRMSRNYWRHAENLPIEQNEARLRYFILADEAATAGLARDDRCAECMLWKFASLGRLATTRGLMSAVRDAAVMAELLDRGIALKPQHRDDANNSTLANLYYASATFYRMVPDWFWLKWVIGVRGDKNRAIRDARNAVALAEGRVDYQVELGAALLCHGVRKGRKARVEEGKEVLRRAIELPHYLPTDGADQDFARILIDAPEKSCGFSRDGFIDVEAVGRQL